MRIWIIKTGEQVPFLPEEKGDQVGRAGQIVQRLLQRGHEVTWWNAKFSHQKKNFRHVESNRPVVPDPNGPEMIFLQSSGYKKHMGVKRLWDHFQLRQSFIKTYKNLATPDVIFVSYPTIELASAAVHYGKIHNVPVVLDVRDLWPDIIYERINSRLSRIGLKTDGWLVPYELMAHKAFAGASGVTAVTPSILSWAQQRFKRPKTKSHRDKSFYQMQSASYLSESEIVIEQLSWKKKGVDLEMQLIRFVWVGNIVPDTDGHTLLESLKNLPEEIHDKIEVVICGNGTLVQDFKEAAKELAFLKVVGWVNKKELSVLLESSHIGLLCYLDRLDFHISIPNKVVDYTLASLRILTNLNGEIQRLAKGTNIVLSYRTGDVANLTTLITNIASDPNRFRKKPPESRHLFQQYFNADKILDEFADYLEGFASEFNP